MAVQANRCLKDCSHLCKIIFPQIDQEALNKHHNSENLVLQKEWKLLT